MAGIAGYSSAFMWMCLIIILMQWAMKAMASPVFLSTRKEKATDPQSGNGSGLTTGNILAIVFGITGSIGIVLGFKVVKRFIWRKCFRKVKSAVEQVPASTETSASAQGPSHAQGLIQDSNPEAPAVFGVNIAAAIPNPAPVIVPDGHPGVITRGRNDILMDWIEYTRLTEEIPAWRAEVARRMGRENIEC